MLPGFSLVAGSMACDLLKTHLPFEPVTAIRTNKLDASTYSYSIILTNELQTCAALHDERTV